MDPSANVSKDTEAEATQRLRVERRGGGGVPVPTCRKTWRRRNPTTTCRKTRRWREPNANVSKDTEAEGTQRFHVERRGGGGNPTTACRKTWRRRKPSDDMSMDTKAQGTPHQHKGPTTRTGDWSRATWLCSECSFHLNFTSFHVPTYQPKEG